MRDVRGERARPPPSVLRLLQRAAARRRDGRSRVHRRRREQTTASARHLSVLDDVERAADVRGDARGERRARDADGTSARRRGCRTSDGIRAGIHRVVLPDRRRQRARADEFQRRRANE